MGKKIKPFYLLRTIDVSGVSGTGIVAVGAVFPDGSAIIEWLTFTSSIAIYRSLDQLLEIHSHGGATEVIMGDPPEEESPKKKGLRPRKKAGR
jgi:hypothetical protein